MVDGSGAQQFDLVTEVLARIDSAGGAIRFDEFMELALYHPLGGFFAGGRGAGRSSGDFITSPEVGPLFGALVGRYLDRRWDAAGQPAEFIVAEAAAGRGALAIAVHVSAPRCAGALRYVTVERSEALRELQRAHLSVYGLLEMGAGTVGDGGVGTGTVGDGGVGGGGSEVARRVYSATDLNELDAAGIVVDVVIANELLDNVPVRLLELEGASSSGGHAWSEVYVGLGERGFVETTRHLDPDVASSAERFVERFVERLVERSVDDVGPAPAPGARVALQEGACTWLRVALELVRPSRGSVLVVDYGRSSIDMLMSDQHEWLRTYRGHEHGGSPLEFVGEQDITCDVAFDQLAEVLPWSTNLSQREWLTDLGIADLVEEGRRIWKAAAAAPDLSAMRARSRIQESEALCDESGLGAFRVVEWQP